MLWCGIGNESTYKLCARRPPKLPLPLHVMIHLGMRQHRVSASPLHDMNHLGMRQHRVLLQKSNSVTHSCIFKPPQRLDPKCSKYTPIFS